MQRDTDLVEVSADLDVVIAEDDVVDVVDLVDD